jgi:hypothetical protein
MKTKQQTLQNLRSGLQSLLSPEKLQAFLEDAFGDDLHAARVSALNTSLRGILKAGELSIHAIGRSIASLEGITRESGTNQIDRLLSNDGIDLHNVLFPLWGPLVVGKREEIVLVIDWTDFEKDDHKTLFMCVITEHGRPTPIYWKTFQKSQMNGKQSQIECEFVQQLHEWIPEKVEITLLADRGFGSQKFYEFLELFGWNYVIRFKGNVLVECSGESKTAAQWVEKGGRAKKLEGVKVTQNKTEIPAVVVVQDAKVKQAWCLATNLKDKTASEIVKYYSRRFTIEEFFRDTKNLHFGMGLSSTHIRRSDRRDRLLFLVAIAELLFVLLGAANEACGLDKTMGSDHTKKRTLSLMYQGQICYDLIPNMREDRLKLLMRAFDKILRKEAFFKAVYGLT